MFLSHPIVTHCNNGGNYNNLYINNNIKLTFDSNGNGLMTFSRITDNITNSFRNTATSITNTYNMTLARKEFVGNDHVLDISGIKFSVTSLSGESESPRVFFSQDKCSGIININNVGNISATFSKLSYSFINLNDFAGYIDIIYNTQQNCILSKKPNVLRLIVLPRPTIYLTVAEPIYHVLPNETTSIYYTIKNIQRINGIDLALNGIYKAYELDGDSVSAQTRATGFIKVTAGNMTIDPSTNLFTIPSSGALGDLLYGGIKSGSIVFDGLNTTGTITLNQNLRVSYTGAPSVFERFKINVCVKIDDIITNTLYANNVWANCAVGVNNIAIIKYIQLDALNNTIDLNVDCGCIKSIFVAIENTSGIPVNVIGFDPLPPYSRALYGKFTGPFWSYLYPI